MIFITPELIKKFVKNFMKSKKFDTGFTYLKSNEYFYFKNKPLNFSINKKIISRRKLQSLEKIVPAATILDSDDLIKRKNIFSNKNYFFKIDWLSSLEISNQKDFDVFSLLIKEYFKKNFK